MEKEEFMDEPIRSHRLSPSWINETMELDPKGALELMERIFERHAEERRDQIAAHVEEMEKVRKIILSTGLSAENVEKILRSSLAKYETLVCDLRSKQTDFSSTHQSSDPFAVEKFPSQPAELRVQPKNGEVKTTIQLDQQLEVEFDFQDQCNLNVYARLSAIPQQSNASEIRAVELDTAVCPIQPTRPLKQTIGPLPSYSFDQLSRTRPNHVFHANELPIDGDNWSDNGKPFNTNRDHASEWTDETDSKKPVDLDMDQVTGGNGEHYYEYNERSHNQDTIRNVESLTVSANYAK
ncbi:hypothetical protein M3Y94_00617500 [Aphelenchoides besseyi]|nr:hypothetical protein M3Y94_00617500 [Aphelenchoides besseyi]KAI6218897.1 hypothetical protein M3Y95_01137000 [Aphelenchoides besseyi]